MQFNGINIAPKIGTDFNTQYSVPDTGLTNNTTIQTSPAHNLHQVKFEGKETDKLNEFANCDIFRQNGLKQNLAKGEHKLFISV
ncbi:MAG: hypothetical protein NC191_00460 [Muribaculaceae bacterium]|nr:hypothetical protein [Muribaculaceae bacterium]